MSPNNSDDDDDNRPACLYSEPTTSTSTGYCDSPEFGALATSLARRLVPLTTNIVQLNRQIFLLTGSNGEEGGDEGGEDGDAQVQHLLAATRASFRDAAAGVKRIVDWGTTTTTATDHIHNRNHNHHDGSDNNSSSSNANGASPAMKSTQQKLLAQFTSTLMDFQSVQKMYAENKRNRVAGRGRGRGRGQRQPEEHAERYLDEEDGVGGTGAGAGGERGGDREEEEEIERGIALVDGMFKDLGVVVGDSEEQQQLANHDDVVDPEEEALLGVGRHGQRWGGIGMGNGRRRAALTALLGALLLALVVAVVVLGLR